MKTARQSKILELIERSTVETQEELALKLLDSGFKVTQATVSRDIKELRLIKIMSKDGKYHYAPFKDTNSQINERIVNVFRESVISVDYSGNMIVIKTLSGTAMAASVAIDSMEWSEVVGCLAGDDTIFVVVRNIEKMEETAEKFKKLMK
ncbi:MAG: arginine repressor [Eubacteriaceae bacterium]|nr:arginine repressor [Eubacteriaceae bacterium]